MKNIDKTIRDIKNLKIQGAEAVARSAVLEIKSVVEESDTITRIKLLNDLDLSKKEL